MKKLLLLLLILQGPNLVFACQFDTDCDVGSKCMKQGNSIYGVCMGGLNPGNQNDSNPAYNPMDMNKNTNDRNPHNDDGTYGDTCNFDLDCGIGGKCIKGSGIYGTCVGG